MAENRVQIRLQMLACEKAPAAELMSEAPCTTVRAAAKRTCTSPQGGGAGEGTGSRC